MTGRSIRIFLVDGKASGVRTLEIGLSTIKGVFAPRSALDALARRPESSKTGVYILLGEDPDYPGRAQVYVGEGDHVMKRILAHDKDESKDFFTRVVLFVSKDLNLTKGHVRYVEARLVRLAQGAGRAKVVNGTSPVGGKLPEADASEMEDFVSQMRLLLATVGVNAFEPVPTREVKPQPEEAAKIIELEMSGREYKARCIVAEGEFVVLKGSIVKGKEAKSLADGYMKTRQQLIASGVLLKEEKGYVFSRDHAFPSASYAATVVAASSTSGRKAWKFSDGRSYGDWLDR